MARKASRIQMSGHDVACPVCGKDTFWHRYTKLNTTGMSLLGLDWANRDALNLVCATCEHMIWFHSERGLVLLDD